MSEQKKKAAALRYDEKRDRAPKLVAKGVGFVAEKILELAKKYEIPIHEDSDLVNALSKLEIKTEIPPELYQAVAEVLAFLYATNKKLAEKMRRL